MFITFIKLSEQMKNNKSNNCTNVYEYYKVITILYRQYSILCIIKY